MSSFRVVLKLMELETRGEKGKEREKKENEKEKKVEASRKKKKPTTFTFIKCILPNPSVCRGATIKCCGKGPV